MAGTLRKRSALDALFADNTAGDISAQDLRDLLWSTEQIFDYTDTTVTTGNVSAAIGEFHRLTVSGMTADRNFILPTCSVGDNPIGAMLVTDAPSAHELVITGDTGVTLVIKGRAVTGAELTRLFLDKEFLVFRPTDTNVYMVEDGRRPCSARIEADNTNAQSVSSSAHAITENGNLQQTGENTGCVIGTGNRSTPSYSYIQVRRGCKGTFTAGWNNNSNVNDGVYAKIFIRNITQAAYILSQGGVVGSTTNSFSPGAAVTTDCAAGDQFGIAYQSGTANVGVSRFTSGNNLTFLETLI